MQDILFIINAAPYGSERALSSLRLATALLSKDPAPRIKIFLLSDAVPLALSGQKVATPPALGDMLEEIIDLGATIAVCRTCIESRGLENAKWINGVSIGTMPQLAEWSLEADKIISF